MNKFDRLARQRSAVVNRLVRLRLIGAVELALLGFFITSCGGGNGSTTATKGVQSSGTGGSTGVGTIRVNVTDFFDAPVAGADVYWLATNSIVETISDEEGKAILYGVPSGKHGRVCASHVVRGYACDAGNFQVPAGSTVELERKLQPTPGAPLATVIKTSVQSDGLSPDGRTLEATIRIAVTQPPSIGSWFDAGHWSLAVTDCVAREGQELLDLGPRCIRSTVEGDQSYSFGGTIGRPVATTIQQPARAATVALLLDQSAPVWAYEEYAVEARIYGAKIFADNALPDTGLLVAAFAGDDEDGINLSALQGKPVTLLPVQNPALFFSKSEIFDQLDGLLAMSGGVAPLYAATMHAIDLLADRALPATRRILVVMANGRDDSCGTPAQCAAMRKAISYRASEKNVEIFLLGRDGPDYLELDTSRTEEAISLLAVDAIAPLIVGSGTYHEAFNLVQQLITGSYAVEDIRIRLTSMEPGTFHSGAVVSGELLGSNPSNCPWYCYVYVLPFSVQVP